MTTDQFQSTYKAFCRRRPFRGFLIEFASGAQLQVTHPEAVGNEGELFVMRRPDGGHVVFAAASVCRVLDVPLTPMV